jgi:hypothetical protein
VDEQGSYARRSDDLPIRKETAVIVPSSILTCMTSSPCLISNTRTTPSRYPTPMTSIAGDWQRAVTDEAEDGEGWGKEWMSELGC